jgi:hypothetical protein
MCVNIYLRLNLGSACYHSVHNLLPFHFLSENVKIKIYKTLILSVVLYECETSFLTLWVFENRGLRRIFGPRGRK